MLQYGSLLIKFVCSKSKQKLKSKQDQMLTEFMISGLLTVANLSVSNMTRIYTVTESPRFHTSTRPSSTDGWKPQNTNFKVLWVKLNLTASLCLLNVDQLKFSLVPSCENAFALYWTPLNAKIESTHDYARQTVNHVFVSNCVDFLRVVYSD